MVEGWICGVVDCADVFRCTIFTEHHGTSRCQFWPDKHSIFISLFLSAYKRVCLRVCMPVCGHNTEECITLQSLHRPTCCQIRPFQS